MIAIDDKFCPESSHLIAETFTIPLLSQLSEIPDFLLSWKETDEGHILELNDGGKSPISIDFLAGKKAHRRQFGGGKGQPLVRAMGQLENTLPNVVDATAGMGGDSYVLASQGFEVTLIERSQAVAALLFDALQRARLSEDSEILQTLQHMRLVHSDSAQYLRQTADQVDVVYMDPMYPHKKKKAAVKKEMAMLQKMLGADTDSENLLDAALHKATYRVVVKRPKGADPVFHPTIQPSTNISSPNTRYDIYSIKALKASGQLSE
ncbi:class I SAM-dependent methyltransferase [Thiomicrorhabdus sp.]|uniref:class I SAM-dependent methyltransferase n=1 Tax=Thiomicrorhabdus sp. TaxID=2039724 RepID=UPI0029C8EB7E|nr:class I SAM-dependent methyltransferase [Thiomicrorhabdus sp.]